MTGSDSSVIVDNKLNNHLAPLLTVFDLAFKILKCISRRQTDRRPQPHISLHFYLSGSSSFSNLYLCRSYLRFLDVGIIYTGGRALELNQHANIN